MPYYHSYSGSHSGRPTPPLGHARLGEAAGLPAELISRGARHHHRPDFGITSTSVAGLRLPVRERAVSISPFVTLIAFDRLAADPDLAQPQVLLLPPQAGHAPTLVRDMVAALLPTHGVHVAAWTDARDVPLSAGAFGLPETTDAVVAMVDAIGGPVHLVAALEAGVIGLAAATALDVAGRPLGSLTLVGGPVDCRADRAGLARAAAAHGLDWFVRAVIAPVPAPFVGAWREAFPGFFTLTGFLTSSLDRALADHKQLFQRLTAGDGDDTAEREAFFEEFLTVADVPAELFLQWVEAVLIEAPFRPERSDGRPPLGQTPLMTIEAGEDAFGGGGQTHAAHDLRLARTGGVRLDVPVGRFGLVNGARWRSWICPRLADFIAGHAADPPQLRPAPSEDILGLAGMTAVLAARLNREGIHFARQLALLDEAAAADLDRRLGTEQHHLCLGLAREARRLPAVPRP